MSFSITVNSPGDRIDAEFAAVLEGRALAVTNAAGDVIYARCVGLWLDERYQPTTIGLLLRPNDEEFNIDIHLSDIDEIEVLA